MKRIIAALFVIFAAASSAQFTLTTSNTVQMSNATKPWVDMADPTCFGNGQIFKSLFFCDGGDLPQLYNQNSWTVSTGSSGGTPTTTSIPTAATGGNGTTTSYTVSSGVVTLTGSYSGLFATQFVQFNGFTSATFLNGGSAFLTSANSTTLVFNWGGAPNTSSTSDTGGVYLGYPPNYFVGAPFFMKNSATGATYGTGTITASTATTLAHGPVFTLSAPLSSVPVNNDVLIVQLRNPSQLMTPFQLYGRLGANTTSACAGMVFNPNDKDPTSTNTTQSLVLPTGCTLTLFADQGQRNATNPNPALAAQQVNNININGSYTQSLRTKCGAASGTGTFSYGVVRGGTTYVATHTVNPSCTNSNGAGWSQPTPVVFTGSETGSQSGNIAYVLNCVSGPCGLQDIDVVEGSTLAGNTSPVRDDVIRTLKGQTGVLTGLKPGGIRWMAPPQWGSYQAQQWQPDNNRAWTNVSNFIPFSMEAVMGYDTMLSVCDVVGVSCYISVGMFNGPSDWASLITTLSTNAHYVNIKNAGNQVYLANGNEAFNSAAGGSLFEGDGVLYGSWFGPNFVAARAASGFDAAHMKLVANSWFAPGQSDGTFGWLGQMLRTAFAAGGANALPDDVEIAPYNFSNLNNCGTVNVPCLTSGLTTSGEPWTGLFSQIPSFDITLPRPSGEGSVIASVQSPASIGSQYAGIKTLVYEMNSGLISGQAATQDQIDSVAAGVGEAVALGEHWEMMQFNSGLQGPLGTFILTEGFNGFNCSGSGCLSPNVSPVWGIMRTMPCGPGQLNTCLPQFRPQGVIMQQVNRTIGSNSNLMASTLTCSGTCSYNYPGGQPSGATNTIPANSAVSLVSCYQRSDLASHQAIDCYNVDTANTHTVTIAGPALPASTVTQAIFPASGQTIVSHNEASYTGTLGTTPTVTLPVVTSTSGVTYTLPAASLTSFTFSTGNNWYVRKGATGTGAGTSWTNAWTDFSSINYSSVSCGDTVWIAGNSTYTTNFTWNKTCTSGNPLTFKGVLASDAVPVASPGWSSAFDVSVNPIHATNSAVTLCCAFVTIDGRVGDAQSQSPYGMQFSYTTDGWTAAWNTSTSQNTDDFIMSHVEVVGPACTVSPNPACTNSNWGVNVCCVKSNTNFTIDHSWIHQWPEVVRPYQSTNLTIQYSYIGEDARVTTGDHEDLIYASNPVTNMVVHDSTLYESGNDGVFMDNGGISGATFYNDIFFHNAGWQISFGKTGTCGPYKVYTSIFESDGTNGEYNYAWLGTGGCTVASGTDMKDNIFYNTGPDFSSSGPGIDSTQSYMSGTVANGVSFPTGCTGCSSFSPASPLTAFTGWVNMLATPVVASDFHLTPSGVTLFQNKGLNLTSTVCTTIPGVCVDRDGTTRPTTGNWTLGPYQTASTPTLAAPTFSPVAGTYTTAQSVTISGSSGATLCYTTDGSTPTASPVGACTHGTTYTTPVSVPSNLTINAIATQTAFFNSAVATAAYVIAPPAPTPTFNPNGGTYTSPQSVTITDAPNQVTMVQYSARSGFGLTGLGVPNPAFGTNYPVTQGNTLILAVFLQTAPASPPTVSNASANPGVVWNLLTSKVSGGSGLYIYAATNCSRGQVFSTPTFSGSPTNGAYAIMEYSGLVTASLLDASSLTGGTGTTLSSGTVTPSANEYMLALLGQNSTVSIPALTAGSFTLTNAGPGNVTGQPGLPSVSYVQVAQAWGTAGTPYNASWNSLQSGVNSIAALLAIRAIASPLNPLAVLGQYNEAPPVTPPFGNQVNPTLNFVQFKNGTTNATTSDTFTPTSTVGAGHTGVLYVFEGESAVTPTITDTLNNSWTLAGSITTVSGLYAFYDHFTTGGTPSITINVGTGNTFTYGFTEYSGVVASSPVDTTSSLAVSGLAAGVPSTGASITTSVTDLIVNGAAVYNTSVGSGFGLGSGFNPSAAGSTDTPDIPDPSLPFLSGLGVSDVVANTGTYNVPLYYFIQNNFYATDIQQLMIALKTTGVTPNYAGTSPNAAPISGAVIHYTTNGTTPTLASPTYTGPLTVSASETINAIAIAPGFSVSPVGTATFIIGLAPASSPTFSPVAGTYATAQSVTLATTTSGGVICYKIGSAPSATVAGTCDAGSTAYSTAINVATSQTIFALTTKSGLANSPIVQSAYVIEVPAATPTFNPVAGTYTSPQTVAILDVTPSASIFYTINGTTPTPSSTPYTGPIAVSVTTTIKAIVTAPGFLNSAIGTAVYTLNLPPAGTPTFTPPAGTYASVQSVILASSTSGASIFYTTDGSTPTPSSTPYTGAINVGNSQTIKAIATKVGFTNSAIGTAVYVITLPPVATPTFAPPAGTYSSSQSVAIGSTTAGASIFYTTDGSTPTMSSTLYTAPITVAVSQTVKAIGVLTGFSNSLVGSAAYTITSTLPGCTVKGTVTIKGTVKLKCPQ